jgi:ABC-type polysaccharide/polyol phosphate export permease
VIYDSARRGPLAFEELRGLWLYRDLILQLVRRNIVARYKRSVLGIAWTMLQPLGMMVVLSLVFARLFQTLESYPVYVLSGLLAWTFFAQTTTAAVHEMVWGGQLLSRIYVPRTVFATSAIGTGLVNLLLALVPLMAVMVALGTPIRWTIVVLPYAMLMLAAFSLGVGLLLSTWAVYFPDVAEMYQVVLVAWMYATPIIYPQEIIPESYRSWLFNLNPMYHLVQLFRQPLHEGILPDVRIVAAASAAALIMLVVGWLVFSQRVDKFAYKA